MKLLLLHPLPLNGSVFADGLRELADECVAPTLYDAGADLGQWAEAALDAIGDGPMVVVGNSVGGSCAIEVARLAPGKVQALVLCGTKPGHRPDPAVMNEALTTLATDGVDVAWERYWRPLFGPTASAETVGHARHAARRLGATALSDGVRAFHTRRDRESFLRSWSGPVWLVNGQHDIHPTRNRDLAATLPNATFDLVDGVGHYLPLEAPDALVDITTKALAGAE